MIFLKDLNIYSKGMNSCVKEVIQDSKISRDCKMLSCINAHAYVEAKKDEFFADSLKNSKWLIPDGIGIVIASKLFPNRIKDRLTGPDSYGFIMNELNKVSGSVAYIGSTDENLEKIKNKVSQNYPNVKILTMISPPFLPEFKGEINNNMVKEINKYSPDILWVGMTAPKQEKWIYDNRKKLNVGVAAAVGAVFDFEAGTVTRAPLWMQRYHLEWLHRFLQNPSRLAKRVFISIPVFLYYVIYERFFV